MWATRLSGDHVRLSLCCLTAPRYCPCSRACGVRRCQQGWAGSPQGFCWHPLLCGTQALAGTRSTHSPPAHHSCNEAPAKPHGLVQGPALPSHPQVAEIPHGTAWELALGIHIDIEKGPFVAIN